MNQNIHQTVSISGKNSQLRCVIFSEKTCHNSLFFPGEMLIKHFPLKLYIQRIKAIYKNILSYPFSTIFGSLFFVHCAFTLIGASVMELLPSSGLIQRFSF